MFAGLALLMAGCVEKGTGQKPSPETPRARNGTKPTHAFLIASRNASGCLISQKLISDHSKTLAAGDSATAVIERKTAEEDLEVTHDVYLAFPAAAMSKLSGYLVAKVSVAPEKEGGIAKFVLESAQLAEGGGKWTLNIEGSGTGAITVTLLYSTSPSLVKAWFSCPEAGDQQPYELSFIPAFAPEGVDDRTMSQSARDKSAFSYAISENVMSSLVIVDRAVTVLNAITKRFGTRESPYLLQATNLTSASLRSVANTAVGKGRRAQVTVIPDKGAPLLVGDENFDPALRQKIAIRSADGRITGAELRIRVDAL